MEIYSIIRKFLVTEKTQAGELQGIYTVDVDPKATKVSIRQAFSAMYGVHVRQVNIIKTREKFKGGKRGPQVKRKRATKAVVYLAGDERVKDILNIQAPKQS